MTVAVLARGLPDWARRVLRTLRHGPDRWLHPLRRLRAHTRIQASAQVNRVVITCLGNICRSPYAEAHLRSLLEVAGNPTPVSSAGLIGPGRPADTTGAAIALTRGHSLMGHASRLLTVQPADALLVLMDPAHLPHIRRIAPGVQVLVLGDLDPTPIDTRVIQDPFGHGPDVFKKVFDRIDRCIGVLGSMLLVNERRVAMSSTKISATSTKPELPN